MNKGDPVVLATALCRTQTYRENIHNLTKNLAKCLEDQYI
jgi:hypothetical protein